MAISVVMGCNTMYVEVIEHDPVHMERGLWLQSCFKCSFHVVHLPKLVGREIETPVY